MDGTNTYGTFLSSASSGRCSRIFDGLGVGGHDDELGDAAVERLGRCCFCFWNFIVFLLRRGLRERELTLRVLFFDRIGRAFGGEDVVNLKRQRRLRASRRRRFQHRCPTRTFVRALAKLLVVGRLLHDVEDRVSQLLVVVSIREKEREREGENE